MQRRDFLQLSAGVLAAGYTMPALGAPRAAAPDYSYLDARLAQRVERGYFDGMSLLLGRGERILHRGWFGKLLSHTAGYPDYQPEGRRRDDYQTLEEAVAKIMDLPAVTLPGARFQYGLAMSVAGRMAELAARQPFDQIFQTRIARPLGMFRSGYAPVSAEPGFSPMLGGSLFTSAADYGRFLMMLAQDGLYRGKRILSRHAVAELQADQVRSALVKRGEYVENARQDLRQDIYGLGQWREEVDRGGSATLISSPGWAGAYSWIDKASKVWGVVIAKANVERAVADGHSTFLGSTIYPTMVRSALDDAADHATKRATAAIQGARLYYEESGSGDPLIFLQGHSFDRRQWQPQVKAFERRHRVIRYDLRGHGRSSQPREGVDFLHAEDLRKFMDALGIGRAHLVGLSLGGFVVTDFIALYPERALSATMAGGDLFDVPGPDQSWTAEALAARRAEIAALRQSGIAPFKQKWLEGLVSNSGTRRETLRQPLWRMTDEWPAWQPLHAEPRLLLGRSVQRHLVAAKPAMPVLIIRGDQEKVGLAITELLPQSNVVTIPDCGHVSNMEQPQLFSAALSKVLGPA